MKKVLIWIIIFIFASVNNIRFAHAVVDPLAVPNNKYGIHVIDEGDLENATSLVNSSGGDWGYVTIVISENERSIRKWTEIFEKLSRLHLIPLIRIATSVEGHVWRSPKFEDIDLWTDFLSSLPWFTRNRYVMLFNEPNHASEWGGVINPEEYALLASTLSDRLKAASDDFYILPAALDASAPNSSTTIDEVAFIRRIMRVVPDFFDHFDGWNSHSYPNPGFSGSVEAGGRGTLRTFLWERQLLRQLGVTKLFQVFITETGWTHDEGIGIDSRFFTTDTTADLFRYASETIWMHPSIVAITPFVLNYQGDPFSHFSWQMLNSPLFYPQFDTYRSIPKTKGTPVLMPTPTPLPTPFVTKIPVQIRTSEGIINILRYPIVSFFNFLVRARS